MTNYNTYPTKQATLQNSKLDNATFENNQGVRQNDRGQDHLKKFSKIPRMIELENVEDLWSLVSNG